MTPLLEAREVTKTFGGGLLDRRHTIALRDFSLALAEGRPSVTAVVGESGSGKTTLARLLLGLLTPTEGEVAYRGRDLAAMSRPSWRTFRREVQAIFQDPYEVYNPFYRVDHVLTVPVAKFRLATSRAGARALIEDALRAVGLRPDETLGRFPHQLSGGQRQRVMVARALLLRPRVILADEPVSMVDASLRATILGALRQMTLDLQIPVIYITHDLATAYQIAENIVVLYRGAVVEAGDVELVVKDPRHPYTRLLVGSIPLPGVRADVDGRQRAGPGEPRARGGRSGLSLRGPLPLGDAGVPGVRAASLPDRNSSRGRLLPLPGRARAAAARDGDGLRRIQRGPATGIGPHSGRLVDVEHASGPGNGVLWPDRPGRVRRADRSRPSCARLRSRPLARPRGRRRGQRGEPGRFGSGARRDGHRGAPRRDARRGRLPDASLAGQCGRPLPRARGGAPRPSGASRPGE